MSWNEQVDVPTVTGIVNDPAAAGVPLALKTTTCRPVDEKFPDPLNVMPSTAFVAIE